MNTGARDAPAGAGIDDRPQPAADGGDTFRQFICRACGYVYDEATGDPDGGLPPGTRYADIPDDWACPLCGVTKADFEPVQPTTAVRTVSTAAPVARSDRRRHDPGVVIVGGGHAGWQVAQALRAADPALPITLVSACSADGYPKPVLSVAIARAIEPDAIVREPAAELARRCGIRLLADAHVIRVDPVAHTVRSTRGTLRWRRLVFAHGAKPRLPAAFAPNQAWRINDLVSYRRLRVALARGPQQVLIVGAGLIGSELANDLALDGHSIRLLDLASRPLAALLPAVASQHLLDAWSSLPIRFIGDAEVMSVDSAPAGGHTVRLADGRTFTVDQIIVATGLAADDRLARSAGVVFDDRQGGIVVDARTMRTSDRDVFALGDCAVAGGRASRFIEPITRQARAIAAAITGNGADDDTVTPEVPIRIKTTALPISLHGRLDGDGNWRVDGDGADGLRMVRVDHDGAIIATLEARPPATSARAA